VSIVLLNGFGLWVERISQTERLPIRGVSRGEGGEVLSHSLVKQIASSGYEVKCLASTRMYVSYINT
jgi:hypothetical protein